MSLSGHTTWDRTKKLQPGKKKNYEMQDLTLDFAPALSTGQSGDKPNAGLHRTSVDWANYREK
jgi:hypothetical protein